MKHPSKDKVLLIRGKDNGIAAWHYVLISGEKVRELKSQKANVEAGILKFGRIIKSGLGEEPPPEVVKEIEELSQE